MTVVERRVVLDEPARVDLGPGGDLALDRVDDDEAGDEALGAEDATVLERGPP